MWYQQQGGTGTTGGFEQRWRTSMRVPISSVALRLRLDEQMSHCITPETEKARLHEGLAQRKAAAALVPPQTVQNHPLTLPAALSRPLDSALAVAAAQTRPARSPCVVMAIPLIVVPAVSCGMQNSWRQREVLPICSDR